MTDLEGARRELAATGKTRVAIAVAPSASAIFVIRDADGALRGVPLDLGNVLAARLGVEAQFERYASSGAIAAAAGRGEWDVSFMPVDAERRKIVDFGAPYHLMQSTYLVAAGSGITSLGEADRAQVTIVGVEGTATLRASMRACPKAKHAAVRAPAEAIELLRSGRAHALAMGRESLAGLQASLPGSRVLEGGFFNSTTAVAVPKNRPAGLAFASQVIEEAKEGGLVRRSFDALGLTSSIVAPAGMQP